MPHHDSYGIPRAPRGLSLSIPRAHRGSGPLGPRPALGDLGHLRPILRRGLLDSYLGWARDMADDFVIWAGPFPHVVAVRPESVRQVLAKDDDFVRDAVPTRQLFGRGLLRMEGEPWRQRRRMVAGAFVTDAMAQAAAIVHQETDRLIDLWSTRRDVAHPARDISFTMMRILGRFLLGFEFDQERHGGRPLHHALICLTSNSLMRHFFGRPAAMLRSGRDVGRSRRWMDGLCSEVLDSGEATAFMEPLRRALRDGDMDRRAVLDELRTFLIAGHETSATALSWIVALMAEHTEAAQSLRAEAAAATRARTYAEVQALQASVRWVKETMRLYPPAAISIWQPTRRLRLGRLELPAGTRVDISSYVLHRMGNVWPEPETFRPDRFAERLTPGAYLPFLMGPHTCLGIHLAMLELPLMAARLAGAFDFQLPHGVPRINLRVSLHPKNFRLRVQRR